ncbi:MAG: membrane protein insertase YidC [Chlamydiia bacterium]|nr:membrane protein insertase YidC [Chlamydiia bacterium]
MTFMGFNLYFGRQKDQRLRQQLKQKEMIALKGATETQNKVQDSTTLTVPFISTDEATSQDEKQKFYVLENDYQQLVFSNVGGSLVEINLPFKSESNTKSVVKEIGFDKKISEESPANARFPLHSYYTSDTDQPHVKGKLGGYYPLLRRGIEGGNAISPEHYATTIISDYPEMASLKYEVTEFTSDHITFVAKQSNRRITKTYTIKDRTENGPPYAFNLSLKIEGDSRGLWLTSGIPEVEIMSNSSSPQVQYRLIRSGKSDVEKIKLPKPKEVVMTHSITPDWMVNSNGFMGVIMDPLSEIGSGYQTKSIEGTKVPTRLTLVDPEYGKYKASSYPGYEVLLPLPSRPTEMLFRFYAGPFEESVLKKIDTFYKEPGLGHTSNYSACRTFYGWFSFISEPFSKVLFVVMKFFYSITHSWALSIILLTIFLRLLLYPLNAWSFKAMRRMQRVSPQVQAIQAKYKKEPKKAQMEIMALYREKKVNPFSGCLPILIQIPFLIGMFDLLKSSFQLRGASFISGWINNLTAPDVLFSWKQPIFFFGNQFHLLPFLLGGVMFLQQKISSKLPKDKSQWTDQQRQQSMMGVVMTIVFTLMFYNFPSGLNIYWLSSMALGIFQQWITNKILDRKDPVEVKKPLTLKGSIQPKKVKT